MAAYPHGAMYQPLRGGTRSTNGTERLTAVKHGYMVESDDAWRDAWFRSFDDADRWVGILRSDDVRRICVYECRHDGSKRMVYEIAR